jgi:hypothetical protein
LSLLAGFENGWDVVPISPVASNCKRPGKHPAVYKLGFWHEPYRWLSREFTLSELAACEAQGAGTGLRFKSGKYFALDVDIDDPALADRVLNSIRQFEKGVFKSGILRIGRAPRFLLLYACEGQGGRLSDTRLEWVKEDDTAFAIDVFCGLGQVVMAGVHPTALVPYRCYRLTGTTKVAIDPFEVSPKHLLQIVTSGQVERLIAWLPSLLSEQEPSIRNFKVNAKVRRGSVVGCEPRCVSSSVRLRIFCPVSPSARPTFHPHK